MKQTAVVICPGRGTYNEAEIGYLQRYHAAHSVFIKNIDDYRQARNQLSISELDSGMPFSAAVHGQGDNASTLIYACALADYRAIDLEKFDIVALTGNSMGWYLALACSGALNAIAGLELVNTMGSLMHNEAPGGQVIYPLVDTQWQADEQLTTVFNQVVESLTAEPRAQLFASIHLGGMAVLSGNEYAINALLERLPRVQGRYPCRLINHAAFHSPLMSRISQKAKQQLPVNLFANPQIPLIDGRGHIWQPLASDLNALYDYTLAEQICTTYDYSTAVDVAIKEFAPDKLIILGPGSTLGAPTAEQLIALRWRGMGSKEDFINQQKDAPFILNMGIEQQRQRVVVSR